MKIKVQVRLSKDAMPGEVCPGAFFWMDSKRLLNMVARADATEFDSLLAAVEAAHEYAVKLWACADGWIRADFACIDSATGTKHQDFMLEKPVPKSPKPPAWRAARTPEMALRDVLSQILKDPSEVLDTCGLKEADAAMLRSLQQKLQPPVKAADEPADEFDEAYAMRDAIRAVLRRDKLGNLGHFTTDNAAILQHLNTTLGPLWQASSDLETLKAAADGMFDMTAEHNKRIGENVKRLHRMWATLHKFSTLQSRLDTLAIESAGMAKELLHIPLREVSTWHPNNPQKPE